MAQEKLIQMNVKEAIESGKDKKGNTVKIPVFERVYLVGNELVGEISSFMNPPTDIMERDNNGQIRKIRH